MRTPPSMALEHEEIHERLSELIAAGGRTGAAARNVEKQLAPHFQEENRFALPPLGVLQQLAREGGSEQMRPAIAMARHVEENLDRSSKSTLPSRLRWTSSRQLGTRTAIPRRRTSLRRCALMRGPRKRCSTR